MRAGQNQSQPNGSFDINRLSPQSWGPQIANGVVGAGGMLERRGPQGQILSALLAPLFQRVFPGSFNAPAEPTNSVAKTIYGLNNRNRQPPTTPVV